MRLRHFVDAASYAVTLVVALLLAFVMTVPLDAWYDVAPFTMAIAQLGVAFTESALLFHGLARSLARRAPESLSMAAWRGRAPDAGARWLGHALRCAAPYAMLGAGLVSIRHFDVEPIGPVLRYLLLLVGVALGAIVVDAHRTATDGWRRRLARHPLGGVRDSAR